jgi:hypothetical protein
MAKFNSIKDYPLDVQRAYFNEFQRVSEYASAQEAIAAADSLLDTFARSQVTEKAETRQVAIPAHIEELAVQKAAGIVPTEILAHIKAIDPKPFLALLEIGSEGVSTGEGIKKVWSFGAIKELAGKVKDGVASLFYRHEDETNKDRPILGNSVWSFTKRVGKSLKAYAVAHVKDEATRERIKSGELDVCSVEGEVEFSLKDNSKSWFVDKVREISGIALASSKEGDTPGFKTAGVVAVIEELNERVQEMAENGNDRNGGIGNLSIDEVKLAIAKYGYKPETLFRSEDLMTTSTVADAIEKAKTEAKTEAEKQVEELKKELEPLKEEKRKQTVVESIEKSPLLTDASEKMRKYIKAQAERRKFAGDDAGEIDKFVKEELEVAKNLGIKFEDEKKKDEDDDGDKTGDDDKKKKKSDNPDDFTTPENNDLIPKDE